MSKDKNYSDTLQRILQGAKFKRPGTSEVYMASKDELGISLKEEERDVWGNLIGEKYTSWWVEEYKTRGNTLVLSTYFMGQSTLVSIDCSVDIQIISE